MRLDWRKHPASDVTKAHMHDRVLLDGEDVTDGCFLADDELGIVGRYLRDANGHFYRDGDDAAHEFLHGEVTILAPVVT